jgi:hypothetical protein
MPNIILTPPRVPLVDPRTGLVDRAWYLFFRSLNNAANDFINNPEVGPSPESLIASYDAALQALAQNVETQPLPVDLSAELTKQIEAAGLADYATGLLSQIAEMQKQLEAFNLLPPPSQGTVVAVTGTAPVVSTGGIAPNISMAAANTSTDGYLTSTDWNTFNNKAPATSGASILYGDGFGGFSNVSTGSGVSFVAGVLSATGSGGTITSVTATAPIASSGGFTPNISINAAYGDTVNPYAAKTANFVLAGPTSGAAAVPTFRALVASDIPVLSYVTSVSGTSPVVSSGGTTPAISMPAATTSVNGYLTSTDWNTFNSKGSGSVTSVAVSGGTTGLTTSGGPITTSGTITFAGTLVAANGGTGQSSYTVGDILYASATTTLSKLADVATGNALISGGVGVAPSYGKIDLTTHVSGTLPTANGGTNLTSFTANGVVYASSTSALATGSALTFDGTNLGIGTTPGVRVDSGGLIRALGAYSLSGTGVVGATSAFGAGTISTDTNWGMYFRANTGAASAEFAWVNGAGTQRMSINSSGIVTMNAYGAGAATFSAAGVISSVSDETWKTKDGAPVNPDAMLKKLQPGYWYYNEEKRETFGEERQLGFYAQNVNAAIGPEAAPEPEEGKPWGYYDRSVLAVVVMSLQNALDTIDSLTARIAALEQK